MSPAMPPPAGGRRSGIKDVARLAGVSHQTVSRVLNGHGMVRDETRQRVNAAISELNYRRNFAARALVMRRSQTVGVVGDQVTLLRPSSLLHSIEETASAAGYLISIATMPEPTGPGMAQALDRLAQHPVDGLIAVAPSPAAADALGQAAHGTPFVVVGAATGTAPRVRVDHSAGARLATRHLLDLGHHTVHHVSGPPEWQEAQDRITGWRAALTEAGRPVPPVVAGAGDVEAGYRGGQRLAADRSVTALFCANDGIALGVLRALHEAGRRIPADVSVVGFDDVPESAFFLPPLTTVRQDFGELGRRSVGLLLEQLASPGTSHTAGGGVVVPELVVRASSAGPAPDRESVHGR